MVVPHYYKDKGDSILNELRKIEHIYAYHREGVWSCPHCGYGETSNMNFWYEVPWMKEVHIQSRLFKMGCIVVVSRCPKCRLMSWIHYEIDEVLHKKDWFDKGYYDKLNSNWDYEAIKKEQKRWWRKAKREWNKSLCKTCKWRKNEPFKSYLGKYSANIECEGTVVEGGETWTFRRGGCKDECEYYLPKDLNIPL